MTKTAKTKTTKPAAKARPAKARPAATKPTAKAKAGKAASAPAKAMSKRAAAEAAARAGTLPAVPDFSAATHKRFRPKLAAVVALVKAKDVVGLRAFAINPYSSSPKAIERYRTLSLMALEAAPTN